MHAASARWLIRSLINLDIAGAAAQVAASASLISSRVWLGIGGEQCLGARRKAGCSSRTAPRPGRRNVSATDAASRLRHPRPCAPVAGARQASTRQERNRRSHPAARAGAAFSQLAAVLVAGDPRSSRNTSISVLCGAKAIFLGSPFHLEGDRGHDVILIRG